MRYLIVLFAFALAGCSSPMEATDGGADAGIQTARLRIVNGCTDPIWIFYLVGSGGGSLGAPNQVLLGRNDSYDYAIPDQGLASARFWPGYGCDATGNNCTIGQSGGPAADGFSCPSYGCAPPIDSKFEGTFGCLPSVPSSDCQVNPSAPTMRLPTTDSWDTSLVDGFTLPYRVRVLDDCAGTGPLNGEIDCSTLPMSSCPASENLSNNGAYPALMSLSMVAEAPGATSPAGCYSDCGRLTYNQWGESPTFAPSDPQAQMYCCPTPPIQPSACRTGPVISTDYVSLVHRTCPQVYAYAYDETNASGALWSCPAGTRYEVTFYCPQ